MTADSVIDMSVGERPTHRVLIVEDDTKTATFMKGLLERQGYEVSVAKDGGQAHTSFVVQRPDFVILDLILAGESGFEVCQRMKQSDETVPVLVVSVIDMPDSQELAKRVGADGYLTKPFDPNQLLESISEISERVWQRTHTEQPKEKGRIRFQCQCGKRFRVSPVHKGRMLTCPDCGERLRVPRYE